MSYTHLRIFLALTISFLVLISVGCVDEVDIKTEIKDDGTGTNTITMYLEPDVVSKSPTCPECLLEWRPAIGFFENQVIDGKKVDIATLTLQFSSVEMLKEQISLITGAQAHIRAEADYIFIQAQMDVGKFMRKHATIPLITSPPALFWDIKAPKIIDFSPVKIASKENNTVTWNFNGAARRVDGAILMEIKSLGIDFLKPPPAPKVANINANIAAAQKYLKDHPLINNFTKYQWFADKVTGEWDYKSVKSGGGSEFEDYGNFHYGAIGAALGIPDLTLYRMAGWAQIHKGGFTLPEWGTPSFENDSKYTIIFESKMGLDLGTPPYGDDPRDQDFIHKGIEWYKQKYEKDKK